MDRDYIQNLRYKLQKRVRRLNSTEYQFFHHVLKQFWGFLNEQPLFSGILSELEANSHLVKDSINSIIDNEEPIVFNTEKKNVLAAYSLIKKCTESDNLDIELEIAYTYTPHCSDHNEAIEAFKDIFIEPFYDFLDENIDDSGFILSLLVKYKHKCEWFQSEYLFNLWNNNTQKGEKLLALHLYEFLHDQGIDFSIEPSSASGEVDLVNAQTSSEPLIADAKIFNTNKSKGKDYISKGFRQIYNYTLDFNKPIGYLVIFKTSEIDLKLPFANESQMTPFVVHNNKTIFFLVIDIFQYEKSASKRGKLEFIQIEEESLWINSD